MKNRSNISYFSYAFMTLFFMGAVSACVNEEDFGVDNSIKQNTAKEGLAVSPTVSESDLVLATTRAQSVDSLKEKKLNTLDVFVEHVSTSDAGKIMKQYHLTNATEGDLNLLANRWRQEGLEDGEKYNIYVAANNPLTSVTFGNDVDIDSLKRLTYNEVTAGVAELDVDGNIKKNSGDATTGNIYKRYSAGITGRAYTKSKDFMMDGVIKNWTPNPATLDQTFDVTMNRAAAKIVLNVKFNADFVSSLSEQGVTITGTPAWKFNNFAFGAPVFDPAPSNPPTPPTEGIEVHNSGFNIFHNQSIAGGAPFTITTYSYPNKWSDTTEAPSLVISVGYTEGTGDAAVTSYNYYRVPIVAKETTSLNRNTIYVINATIATRGSDSHEDITEMDNLVYEVLPWNDENNSAAIHDEVQSVQNYYFKVNPIVYTLRGDGDQSVDLNYLKASGTKVNWKLFTYDANGNQTGVVANNASNAVRAWFYDAKGKFTTTYDDDSSTDWSKMGVNIVQSTEGTSGSSGKITVTSTALNNKGIKYIRLRVYLDEEVDGESLENDYHQDIIIRHFPTDNIQGIEGSWSSYHPTGSSSEMVTLTTRILSEAQSWAEQYGVNYTTSEATATDNITPSEYIAHSSETGYARVGYETRNRQQFRNALTQNADRQAANGEENAILAEDGYYYWGVNPSTTTSYNNSDYYTGYYDTYYQYQNRYRAQFTHSYTYTQYSVTVPMSSTGNWVDWDDRSTHNTARTYQINYGNYSYQTQSYQGTFLAKVYNDGIYQITESGSNYAGWTTTYGTQETGLNNNHMYVIQISSTSASYVLGRPYVNQTTHQSDDNVVSPAFMIASQLGAVLPFTGNNGPANAATHCSQYMEVSSDGMRYTGWRLPTKAEISVITGYQYGDIGGVEIPDEYQVLTPVLTGRYYHSLSGEEVEANPNAGQGSQTKSYLRCVRDLSAEEVDRLNGFDKIIEKYQN